MKLNLPEITVERSGVTTEISMGIDKKNQHIIMNMLRNQIYSNSIESLVRELLANAIDAHVACGKADVPIRINLPTNLSEYLEIIDEGASMDKKHIEEVYAQLGSSSKRESNELIGSYGIGSASPLSYTDSFFIETKTFEDGKYIKRVWVQYIDETLLGKLSLLEESECDSTGTTIKVAIKREDYTKVNNAVIKYSYFLKPRPITNLKLEYPNVVYDYTNGQWASLLNIAYKYEIKDLSNSSFVVVGNVPYSLDYSDLDLDNVEMSIVSHWAFHLFVPIGSVSLIASRESLQFTDDTKKYVSGLIREALQYIKNKIKVDIDEIESAESYIDYIRTVACKKLKPFLPTLKWNTVSINNNGQLKIDNTVVTHIFRKDIWRGGERKFIHRSVKDPDIYLSQHVQPYFILDKEGKYLDSKPSPALVETLLNNNTSKYIISLRDPNDSKYWSSPLLPQEAIVKVAKQRGASIRGSMSVYTLNHNKVNDTSGLYEMFEKERIFYKDKGFYIKLENRAITASQHIIRIDNWNGVGRLKLKKLLSHIPQNIPVLKPDEIEKLGPDWKYLPDYLAQVVEEEGLQGYIYYSHKYEDTLLRVSRPLIQQLCLRLGDIEEGSDIHTVLSKVSELNQLGERIPTLIHHSSIEYEGPSLYQDLVNIQNKYKLMRTLPSFGDIDDNLIDEVIVYLNRTHQR